MFKIKYIRTNLLNSAFDEYLGDAIENKMQLDCLCWCKYPRKRKYWLPVLSWLSDQTCFSRLAWQSFLLFCDKWNYLSFPIERFSKISAACLLPARQSFRPYFATIVARLSPSTFPAVIVYVVHNV